MLKKEIKIFREEATSAFASFVIATQFSPPLMDQVDHKGKNNY